MWLVLLPALCLLLYVQTLGFGYTLDDVLVIQNNALVSQGASAIPALLSGSYLEGAQVTGLELNYYRPLSLITFAIEESLWGTAPEFSHLLNVGLYALTAVVLLGVLRRLVSGEVAVIAALLFAAHPLHVEVVASIKSRDELLGLLLHLGALGVLLSGRSAAAVAGIALLAMLAKESALLLLLTAPLVLIFEKPERSPGQIARRCAPLLGALLAWLFLRLVVAEVPLQVWNAAILELENNALLAADGLAERIATAVMMAGWYLWLFIHPHPQVYDYSIGQIPIVGPTDPRALGSLVIIAVMGALAWRGWRQKAPWGFALLFAGVNYALVSNLLVLVAGSTMAERYLYTPSVGLALLVALLIGTLKTPPLRLGAAAVLLTALSGLTLLRVPAWADNLTLVSRDVLTAPGNPRILRHYEGNVRTAWKAESPEAREELLQVALLVARQAASIAEAPDAPAIQKKAVLRLLGRLLILDERPEEAIEAYNRALEVAPQSGTLRGYRGFAYWSLGRLEEAEADYAAAIQLTDADLIDPSERARIHYNLCRCRYDLGRHAQALPECMIAVSLDPDYALAHLTIGNIHIFLGELEEGQRWIDTGRALEGAP